MSFQKDYLIRSFDHFKKSHAFEHFHLFKKKDLKYFDFLKTFIYFIF
jgi:hypothetical protein